MRAKSVYRLSLGLLVITSVFFGFVLASLFLETGNREAVAEHTYPLTGPQLNETDGSRPEVPFSEIAARVSPSVVNIIALTTRTGGVGPSRGGGSPKGGSGIILDSAGFILTNWHVVSDSDKVIVTLIDNSRYSADVVGGDAPTDLALLKIEPHGEIHPAILGRSKDVKPGQWVVAIGHPEGLSHTITVGVVSAVERSLMMPNPAYWNYIQTDAAINPGNSGGPLLNSRGEVIGINTMIYRGRQNLGFSIPIDLAKTIIAQLRQNGHVRRGYMGLHPGEITEDIRLALDLPDRSGAIVNTVVQRLNNGEGPLSPAYKAGIRPGDIITSFDGKHVDNVHDFYIRAAYTLPGSTVELVVLREGKPLKLKVTLAARPGELPTNLPKSLRRDGKGPLGIKVKKLGSGTRQLLRASSAGMIETGVVVADLDPASDAYNKGIRPGDIIAKVDGRAVSSPDQFESAARAALRKAVTVLLHVGRPNGDQISWRFIAIRNN